MTWQMVQRDWPALLLAIGYFVLLFYSAFRAVQQAWQARRRKLELPKSPSVREVRVTSRGKLVR